jgi:hypothetical protein
MINKVSAMKQDQSKSGSRKAPTERVKSEKSTKAEKLAPAKRKSSPTTAALPAQPLKKDKLIRDSFTLPREDFELIAALKDRALDFKRPTKKSELLRAGLQVLASLDQAKLRTALDALRPLKAGRPKNKP